MLKPLRTVARVALEKANLYSLVLLKQASFLSEIGWFQSYEQKQSIDRNGGPLPWVTYSMIAFLEPLLRRDLSVFEFGCGNSTLWWAARVGRVVSVEHDAEWRMKIAPTLPPNAELHHVELIRDGAYCRKAAEYPASFDLISIDGRDRVNCAKNSLSALRPGGVILWDNSEREEYIPGTEFLKAQGFRRIDFWGMGPINLGQSCTSIFYRTENCLGI